MTVRQPHHRGASVVSLEPFPIPTMKLDTTCMFLGQRGTGKSTALRYFMSFIGKRFHKGLVLRGVDTDDYPYVPLLYIHNIMDGYDTSYIEHLIELQSERVMRYKMDPSETEPPRLFLIFEDVGTSKSIMNDTHLNWLFANGRHIYTTVFVMCQRIMQLPKALRDNLDYMVMMDIKNEAVLKYIRENFMSFISKFSVFNHIFKETTKDNGILVYHNNKKSSIEECLFTLRIPLELFKPVPKEPEKTYLALDFEICNEKYRRTSDEHFYDLKKTEMRKRIERKLRRRIRHKKREDRNGRVEAGEFDPCKVSTVGSDTLSSMLSASSGNIDYDDDEMEDELERDWRHTAGRMQQWTNGAGDEWGGREDHLYGDGGAGDAYCGDGHLYNNSLDADSVAPHATVHAAGKRSYGAAFDMFDDDTRDATRLRAHHHTRQDDCGYAYEDVYADPYTHRDAYEQDDFRDNGCVGNDRRYAATENHTSAYDGYDMELAAVAYDDWPTKSAKSSSPHAAEASRRRSDHHEAQRTHRTPPAPPVYNRAASAKPKRLFQDVNLFDAA